MNQQSHQQANKNEKASTDFQFSSKEEKSLPNPLNRSQQTEPQRNSANSTRYMDTTNQAPLKMKLKKKIIQEILKFASTQELQRLQQIYPTEMAHN